MAQIKTFAFLDLETTDLPCNDNNTTKIIEISLIAVQTNHLLVEGAPIVKNKLVLCLNPRKMISSDTERMTGLSNAALKDAAPFTAQTVTMIVNFLNHNPKPICLVAHNGNKFDYPILQTEIRKSGCQLPDDIWCIDSLDAFKALEVKQPVHQNIQDPDLEIFEDGFNEVLCWAFDAYETKGITRIKITGVHSIRKSSEISGPSKLCALNPRRQQYK